PPAPIETKIISAPRRRRPPPPLPQFATPPPLFVPPPEVTVVWPPPPPQSTAPTVTTTIAPPTPAPTAPPARVQPHLDLAHSSQPDYPPEARRLGKQGSLILQVLVEADGRVSDSKLVQSSGFPVLDQAALAGVKTNYRFVPGTVGGTPQPMWFTFRFVWRLQ
ncbi:MAG TPA: energy transducer TonB, partial [Stellaceae bacterium]|nr:energy transducer TonB [Stellaceae bacterium]